MLRPGSLAIALSFLVGSCVGPRARSTEGASDDAGAPDSGGLPGLTTLEISPAGAVLRSIDGAPGLQAYTVTGSFVDGTRADLTAQTALFLANPELGSFAGGLFRASVTRGGRTRVVARSGAVGAETDVTVVVESHVVIPAAVEAAVPRDAAARFGGTLDSARAPTLVYPNDGVLLPPNLGSLEIQFLRGIVANTLFAVRFTSAVADVRLYARCERPADLREDGCRVRLDGPAWTSVAESNRGGEPIALTVSATDDAGGSLGTSEVRSLSLSADDLAGTIYYWSTTYEGVMRFDFAGTMTTPEPVLGPEHVTTTESGRRCVGCHALSRDGRKLFATVGGVDRGGMLLTDLEAGTIVRNQSGPDDHVIQFASFRPDGEQLAGVYGDSRLGADLLIFDTRCDAANLEMCGVQVDSIPLGNIGPEHPDYNAATPRPVEASHPDWSADGNHIAFADVGNLDSPSQWPEQSAIAVVDRAGATFGAPRFLVPRQTGANRFSPHFAPDSSFVVFNESVCDFGTGGRSCNADSDPSTRIFAVLTEGGIPVHLARADAPATLDETDALADTFPRFAPFVSTLATDAAGTRHVMWLTFSSTRRYGLRPQNAGTAPESALGTWLWMVAVEPERVALGEDPSFAAFMLPFQDLASSNHVAVWAERAVGDPGLL